MATNGRLGFGAQFQLGDGGGTEVFTSMAEVVDVVPPEITRDTVDATHHGSANRGRDFLAGLVDGGEISLVLNYTNSTYATLFSRVTTTTTANNYRVVGPNGAIWQASAFITALGAEIPLDDKMQATVTLKVTGLPTYTAGS